LKAIEEEKKRLSSFREDTEVSKKELEEAFQRERAQRKIIDDWLREKFSQEVIFWSKKWATLLRQLELNRDNLTKVPTQHHFFSSYLAHLTPLL